MDRYIAVDPGASGAIVYRLEGPRLEVVKMPDTVHDIVHVLQNVRGYGLYKARLFMENVGFYRPTDGGRSATKFSRHVGNLEGVAAALELPVEWIQPSTWEHWLIGPPRYPKIPKTWDDKRRRRVQATRKRERKNKIKARVQELHPELRITLQTADAVGIWEYVTRR